ncbi:extracellular solute-binding protein [Paenibacillus koleovorans]|uniref:extracellular solute-binding protein n=1 Tax=Paenibacillus koleovorans TaxID=121608 RepID=UPI000FD8EA11|nr:extracellular solute-binding protein [Paenibacillus koleovorans]
MASRKSYIMSMVAAWLAISFVFSGCGKSPSTETQKDAVSTDSSKPVTLKYLSSTDKFNPDEDYTGKRIKELLHVELVSSMGTEADKLNMILSSGQDYDMINLSATARNLLGTYIKNGALQPLNEAIDKYGPNLKKAFTKEVWDMVSSDGKIYAIPTTNYTAVVDGIVIREDWLKKLNLAVPTTPDELYAVLKAFKEKDPGGLGAKNIPFSMAGADTGLEANGLSQAFGIGKSPTSIVEKSGSLVNGLETSGAKEYVTYMHKLYAEGLLDADYPITKKDKLVERIGAGLVGAAYIQCWDSAALKALQASNAGANLIYLAPLKSKDGKQLAQDTGGLYQFLIVPKTSKNVNEVVKYANAFLDPANYTKLILGEEGVTFKVENGQYYPIFPAFNDLNKGRWFYPVNESKLYTPLFAARARKEKEMGQLWDDVTNKSSKFMYSDITNFAPMMPSVEKYGNQLDILVKDRLVKMVLDAKELDKLDALVNEWKEKGGQAVMTEYNNWYKNRTK